MSTTATGGWALVVRRLGPAPWLVAVAGLVAVLVLPADQDGAVPEPVLIATLAAFFLVVLARLLAAAAAWRERSAATLSLAAGVALWAAGAAVLNSAGTPSGISFPAPGEWLFLAAYAGMAGFLILGGHGGWSWSSSSLLDALVVCGGAVTLAGAVVVTPLSVAFDRQGVPLLVALTYPLLDVVLLALLLGQVVGRSRPLDLDAVLIGLGLVLLGFADVSLVQNLARGTYSYGPVLDGMWLLAFLLLSAAACRPPRERGEPRVGRGLATSTMLLAEVVALVVLTVQPDGPARPYVVVPAVITLLAAGARLVQALRVARGAAEAYRLSRTDDLTGLPNRRAVTARLGGAIHDQEEIGLLLLDLDGFKEINDSLGHGAGDLMLTIVANRLRRALPARTLVSRLGGDEFAIVVPDSDPIRLLEQARQVLDVIRKPARVDGLELQINASVGVTVREPEDVASGDLLRRADVAMYQAKSGRAGALLYDAARDDFSRQRLTLAEDLRRALADGQLEVWYQPQVEARSRRLVALEALVRWRHPTEGLISPGAFLPVARRAGLMGPLSEFVVEQVVADLVAWRAEGFEAVAAVNLAPPELLGGVVLHTLFDRLLDAELPADSLVVEVTEDSFLAEPERARDVILEIRGHGVQVSIDDYGTGFSSLSYLRDLPIHELKIDRSFIAAILSDPRSTMIVATTTQMAHGLGLRCVAEGVEDERTLEALVELGLDLVQGYHIARPMPAGAVMTWVRSRTPAVAPVLGGR